MNSKRFFPLVVIALASMVCACSAFWKKHEDEDESSHLLLPQPKTFSIFSRPDPHGEKNAAPGIITHLGNVLHGGTIGVQFETRPLGVFHGILGHAKKVLPGGLDQVGEPSYEKPPKKDEHWEENEDGKVEKHDEKHKEWEWEKPDKPNKHVGPGWEDIGEDPEGYSTDVPIEDIIQPRLRTKRFIQSKIYHVPLLYRSNGRPYHVKIRNPNDLDDDFSTTSV